LSAFDIHESLVTLELHQLQHPDFLCKLGRVGRTVTSSVNTA